MSQRQGSKLSVKQLESYIRDLDDFESPKIELEQYATPPHIAAMVLNLVDSVYDDINGKFVADLGCGTGRLTIGSIMCGASMVMGLDIDREALKSTLQNISDIFYEETDDGHVARNAHAGCGAFNLIQTDISSRCNDKFWEPLQKKFDTVIMNPPFGTKQNQGLDMLFLKRAVDIAHGSVYSLHKTSTRDVSF